MATLKICIKKQRTEEIKANLEANRRRDVGRPRKGESGSKNNESGLHSSLTPN